MKSDLGYLLLFIWMSAVAYFVYAMWIDVKYIADLMHVYVKMAMSHVGH